MENLILKKETLDLLEKVYINNLESVLLGEGNKDPKGALKRVDTSIEIVEFIGTLLGYFGKFKTDKIELIIKNSQTHKWINPELL